jgi:hypothetical protein
MEASLPSRLNRGVVRTLAPQNSVLTPCTSCDDDTSAAYVPYDTVLYSKLASYQSPMHEMRVVTSALLCAGKCETIKVHVEHAVVYT